MRIAFIGGGNMASALIAGLLREGFGAERITVIEHNADAQRHLHNEFRVSVSSELDAAAVTADVVVLAVKPQQLRAVAEQLAPLLDQQLVVSIAAGVRADTLSAWLGNYERVVRTMPNTPAMIGAGVTALFALPAVSALQCKQAEVVMEAAGSVLWLEMRQRWMPLLPCRAAALRMYSISWKPCSRPRGTMGIERSCRAQLTLETFLGAAKLAESSPEDVALLRARVTSKGGTTEQAIMSMQAAGVQAAIVEAVHAAARRSKELGDALANAA
jgi:pyrroline-5-carboxylate reductase